MHRRRSAFSLVELLVVIGIIGLFIAILMPALSRARESARQIQCAAQLRQIGQALYNYASSNRGSYPAFGDWHVWGGDGTGEDTPGPGWTEELIPYFTKDPKIYNCSEFPEGYPFNYFLGVRWLRLQDRWSILASEIKNSTEFILAAECTHGRLYPKPWGQSVLYTTSDCDKDDAAWKCLSWRGEQSGFNVHHAGNNILFADGHVACFAKFDPQQMTFHPKKAGVDWEDVTAP